MTRSPRINARIKRRNRRWARDPFRRLRFHLSEEEWSEVAESFDISDLDNDPVEQFVEVSP